MYSLLKPVLFQFDPEKIHYAVTSGLQLLNRIPGGAALSRSLWNQADKRLERGVFGLKFKNPVGLAAGFDKNGELIAEMANLGFSFVELGTVTPLPQPGNEKPRMFRLPADSALINRMGFNNKGADVLAARIAAYRKSEAFKKNPVIIGGNIGKNKNTPNEQATDDYVKCFNRLFEVVDYFVVNVSSPNTPGLRALQEKGPLLDILNTLQHLNRQQPATKPILLKIAPDLTNEQLDDIIDIIKLSGIAGVIATNTTISREALHSSQSLQNQTGGLSGKPLTQRSTEVIKYLVQQSGNAFPVIGVGGIHSAEDAIEKLEAGASLVQLYTGFIYEGPALIGRINKKILSI
ncbi:quinone-dependent dihydroorotate dehydrogenase [Mucilaginibacter sp.]